jgi:hypothetical protein
VLFYTCNFVSVVYAYVLLFVCTDVIPPTLLKNSISSLEYLKLDYVNLNERQEFLYIVSVPSLVELDTHVNMNTYVSYILSYCRILTRFFILQSYSVVDVTQPCHPLEELKCNSGEYLP